MAESTPRKLTVKAASKDDSEDVMAGSEPTAEDKAKVEPLEPGDDGYNPYTDPVIPSSTLALDVAAELAGGGESPTRDALVDAAKSKDKK